MGEKIAALGLELTPSACNFHLVRFPAGPKCNAAAADAYLRSRGIIVRAMGSYGLGEWLRMTIGTEEENTLLMHALNDFVASWEHP
jgi:histidinol-phosphate aminotransferase